MSLDSYQSAHDFLSDHLRQIKERNPSFTPRAWSLKLGLENASTLTRVLNGQRHPGESLIKKLCDYFSFEEKDEQRFRLLVRIDKEKDQSVRSHLVKKLIEPSNNYIEIKNKMILCWGFVDRAPMDKRLEGFEMTSTSNAALPRAVACLKVAQAYRDRFPTCNEFNFAVYIKDVYKPLDCFSMFFDYMVTDDKRIDELWRGSLAPFAEGSIDFDLRETEYARGKVSSEQVSLSLSSDIGNREQQLIDDNNIMYSFNTQLGPKKKCRIDIETNGYHYAFDPKYDSVDVDPKSPIASFLNEVNFEPQFWSLHEKFGCRVYEPESRKLT